MIGRRRLRRGYGFGLVFSEVCRRLYAMGLGSPSALRVLLAMGILSLIFLAVPGIYILFLFTGVGIPLIPAVFLFPPIVLVWCCVLAFRRVLPGEGTQRTVAAFVATALFLAVPAQLLNLSAHKSAAKFTTGDHDSMVLPLHSETLAIVNRRRGGDLQCDRLCLHTLLSGAATTVILGTAPVGTSLPDTEQTATAYYFERRGTCPEVELDPRHYVLSSQARPRANGYIRPQPRNAAEIGAQRIASGNCLLSREAQISEADLMLVLGPVLKQPKRNHGFGFRISGMEIARLSLHQATGAGEFSEVFRDTSGEYMQFFPFLLPMAGATQYEPSGWLRTRVSLNDHDYSTQLSRDVFSVLEEDIGLQLTLDDRNYRKDAQSGILEVLRSQRAPTSAEWQAFTLYWNELNFLGTGTNHLGPNTKDAEIALRIAQSPDMPIPRGFADFVRYAMMTKLVPADDMGNALAARLGADGTKKDLQQAALGMAKLPDSVLQRHQQLIADLARTPDKRSSVRQLLHKLYLSGASAAPILRDLVLDGLATDDLRLALQGLTGLCKIGPEARAYVENLGESRISLDQRDAAKYFRKRIALSAALGIDSEKLRRTVPRRVIRGEKPGWFEKQYKYGTSNRWHCYR